MDNKVYIVRCTDYQDIEKQLTDLIILMGGMDRYAKLGEKIIVRRFTRWELGAESGDAEDAEKAEA